MGNSELEVVRYVLLEVGLACIGSLQEAAMLCRHGPKQMHRQGDTERERERERQTDRDRDKEKLLLQGLKKER